MSENTPEEAAHAHAKALVEGDVATAFLGMTPDGLASAIEVGNTTWNILSYELGEQRQEGDDFIVSITYATDLGQMGLQYRFRDVEGMWKIDGVQLDE